MADLVSDCYWFLPAHQHVFVGETIALQAQSVIAHLQQTFVTDVVPHEIDPHTYLGSYMVIWTLRPLATAS